MHDLAGADPAVALARWEHDADAAAIATSRDELVAFAHGHGMGGDGCRDLAMAVSEAVTNVVRHAYPEGTAGRVMIDAATDDDHLTVRVADEGEGGAGTSLGLGVPVMEALSDRLEIGPRVGGRGTVVTLEFTIGAAASSRLEQPVG